MNSLLRIVGHLMTDSDFADALSDDTEAGLSKNGYTLTGPQMTIASKIANSLRQGKLDDGIAAAQAQCPVWPCSQMSPTLQAVLGDMLVHEDFRLAMLADRANALAQRGYTLNQLE